MSESHQLQSKLRKIVKESGLKIHYIAQGINVKPTTLNVYFNSNIPYKHQIAIIDYLKKFSIKLLEEVTKL